MKLSRTAALVKKLNLHTHTHTRRWSSSTFFSFFCNSCSETLAEASQGRPSPKLPDPNYNKGLLGNQFFSLNSSILR
ncbi:hypothetical protein PDJAM_G00038360, partial [Pangasius djambal]|nr:hypothetical protein [Pangasius djambal]